MDASEKFLALVIPKPWCFVILFKVHDKLCQWGVTKTYHIIKWQYCWNGMNKDICKYIINCTFCKREKGKMQMYPLQMMDIPDQPFNKIAIDLITDPNVTMSGNHHILTNINHLTSWLEAFPITNKRADTIICIFINNYLQVDMCPRYLLFNNGTKLKNQLMDDTLNNLVLIMSSHSIPSTE